ncbi:flagellar basal body L-ring protein FlgH [soil metagenome]
MRALRYLACAAALLLAGCAADIEDIGVQPHLTPVGSGITNLRDGPITASLSEAEQANAPLSWEGTSADLYRDPRARHTGDIVTVNISIDDKATLDNNSDRSRDSKVDASFGVGLDFMPTKYPLSGEGNTDNSSSSKGKGSIDRSEKINLSVAALVTEVLPNGNLVLSGSQEVRVNFEVRVLSIAGVVRPQDISRDNTIPYEKIAEARVSYGGRGRLTEVQQPGVGQQLFDLFVPF